MGFRMIFLDQVVTAAGLLRRLQPATNGGLATHHLKTKVPMVTGLLLLSSSRGSSRRRPELFQAVSEDIPEQIGTADEQRYSWE
jgi:hypothetical protein